MASWQVGEAEIISCRLDVDGVEVTTGTVNVYLFIENGGTEWVDGAETGLTATRTALSCTYDADVGWKKDFTPFLALDSENVSWEMHHDTYGFIASGSALVGIFDGGSGGSSSQVDVKLQG